jgi:hypothetical protein
MGVLTKYDKIEPIYLPQSIVTYISLHPVYIYFFPPSVYGLKLRDLYTSDTSLQIAQQLGLLVFLDFVHTVAFCTA